ncbi:MAG: GNAT family N-acetyltransferase [Planctomycetota bacterium]
MTFEARSLTRDTLSDFFELHSAANGGGWCHCVAWAVPTWDGWGDRTAEENRALREERFRDGDLDQILLYEDERPVASCQIGPRDRFPKILAQFGLEKDANCWAITCFFVAPDRRGRGAARALLEAAIEKAKSASATRLQAFPRRGEGLDAGEVWNGPEAMFAAARFRVYRDDPVRPVLQLDLGA